MWLPLLFPLGKLYDNSSCSHYRTFTVAIPSLWDTLPPMLDKTNFFSTSQRRHYHLTRAIPDQLIYCHPKSPSNTSSFSFCYGSHQIVSSKKGRSCDFMHQCSSEMNPVSHTQTRMSKFLYPLTILKWLFFLLWENLPGHDYVLFKCQLCDISSNTY